MTVLGALASRREVSNSIGMTPWGDWSDHSTTWAGVDVSTGNATQLLTVYGCVRYIADGISTLPVDVLRRTRGAAPAPVSPVPPWLEQPTADLDFVAWCGQVLWSLLLDGNAYVHLGYAGAALRELTPIDPSVVRVTRERGRLVYTANGLRFTSHEILHIRSLMAAGDDVGLSPVEAARQTIGAGLAAQEYTSRFFGDDATPPGVIEVPTELTPDQAKDMARSWARAHSGKSNRSLPGVLQGGAMWKPTAVTNEQAQFLQTRKFTASQIASEMFLIDPSEMGLPIEGSSITYGNLEQRNARKVQVTFLPWIIRLERALSSLLPRPQYVKLNTSALLRGDTTQRYAAYQTAIGARFMVPNEARAFEDWAPLDGGDEFPAAPSPQETS